MHFKLAGLLFLLAGGYLAADAIIIAERQHNEPLTAQVYILFAIFLATTVRVLQAEKHHRERLRQAEQAPVQHTEHEEIFSRS